MNLKSIEADGNEITDLPEGGLKWSSDNPSVANVEANGTVTRISTGECNITASIGAVESNKCVVKCA